MHSDELSATFYVALLRSMGCTGNSFETAALFGGEDLAFLGLVQRLRGADGREWARAATALVAATAPAEVAAGGKGGGRSRGGGGGRQGSAARAADAYVAMTSDRPHRAALSADAAAAELHRAVAAGQLCRDAVHAVLDAAGHGRAAAPPAPCGLTEREVEVLARWRAARRTSRSPRRCTSRRARCSTTSRTSTTRSTVARAGAAMFALEHRLLAPGPG